MLVAGASAIDDGRVEGLRCLGEGAKTWENDVKLYACKRLMQVLATSCSPQATLSIPPCPFSIHLAGGNAPPLGIHEAARMSREPQASLYQSAVTATPFFSLCS